VSATAAASFTLEAVDRLRTIVGVIDVIIFLGIEPALRRLTYPSGRNWHLSTAGLRRAG
jgi:hypothetical protein